MGIISCENLSCVTYHGWSEMRFPFEKNEMRWCFPPSFQLASVKFFSIYLWFSIVNWKSLFVILNASICCWWSYQFICANDMATEHQTEKNVHFIYILYNTPSLDILYNTHPLWIAYNYLLPTSTKGGGNIQNKSLEDQSVISSMYTNICFLPNVPYDSKLFEFTFSEEWIIFYCNCSLDDYSAAQIF